MSIDAFQTAVDHLHPLLADALDLAETAKRPASVWSYEQGRKGIVADVSFPAKSAHAKMTLAGITPRLISAIHDLDAAFHGLSWANHPEQKLRWTAFSDGAFHWRLGAIPSQTRGTLPFPGRHGGLNVFADWVRSIHHHAAHIQVAPTDPTWKVSSKPVGAPDAGTARVLAELFANPRAPVDPRKPKTVHQVVPLVDVRAQTRAALAAMEHAHYLRTVAGRAHLDDTLDRMDA